MRCVLDQHHYTETARQRAWAVLWIYACDRQSLLAIDLDRELNQRNANRVFTARHPLGELPVVSGQLDVLADEKLLEVVLAEQCREIADRSLAGTGTARIKRRDLSLVLRL